MIQPRQQQEELLLLRPPPRKQIRYHASLQTFRPLPCLGWTDYAHQVSFYFGLSQQELLGGNPNPGDDFGDHHFMLTIYTLLLGSEVF